MPYFSFLNVPVTKMENNNNNKKPSYVVSWTVVKVGKVNYQAAIIKHILKGACTISFQYKCKKKKKTTIYIS